MKLHRLGMRTIKTAIAVTITLFIGSLLNIESPLFAGIAAIISMESSVSQSFKAGRNRMYGTLLGGVVALIFSIFLPANNPIVIGVGTILVIYICNQFRWKESIKISAMVFLSIGLHYESGNQFYYVLYRSFDTLLGLTIGTLVNYFVLPHNVTKKVVSSMIRTYQALKDMLEIIIWQHHDVHPEKLRKDLIKIEDNYEILRKELKLHSSKQETQIDFKRIFVLFENTYNHLSIITSFHTSPIINDNNKVLIESFFRKKITTSANTSNADVDFVYNYHLTRVVENLKSLDAMLNHPVDPSPS